MGTEQQYLTVQPRLRITVLTYYQHLLSGSMNHSIFFQLISHFLASIQPSPSLGSMAKPYANILKATVSMYSDTTNLLNAGWHNQNFVVSIFLLDSQ